MTCFGGSKTICRPKTFTQWSEITKRPCANYAIGFESKKQTNKQTKTNKQNQQQQQNPSRSDESPE